jgi:urease beta subunit
LFTVSSGHSIRFEPGNEVGINLLPPCDGRSYCQESSGTICGKNPGMNNKKGGFFFKEDINLTNCGLKKL